MSQRPIIVGGGPAGMAAAIELAKYRVPSVLFDEASRTGGVVYRGPLRDGVNLDYLGSRYRNALHQLHEDFAGCAQWIETRLHSRIVGGDDSRLMALDADDKLHEVEYKHLLLAAGCHERSVPFPGWTLPGVILLGGLQLQIKSGVVKPLGRTLIAGTGPLLPLVACQLHAAGAEVAGVYEACGFNRMAKESLALMNKPQLFLQGLSLLAYMKLHGIAMHYGWGVVRAAGGAELGQVQLAPYDQQWQADLGRVRCETVEILAVGYGFIPRTQLSQQLGLAHTYSEDGYLRAECNTWQQSSVPHIHVAGDMAGICGGEAGLLTGRIAALSILQQMGVLDSKQAQRKRECYEGKLATIRRFRAGVERYTARGTLQLELPEADTVICRCEHVTRSAIDLALEQGVPDMASLKMRTRVSMGDCQGRMCVGYCSDRLRASTGRQDVGWLRPRFPIDPIPFSAFENLHKEAEHEQDL
ncbi:MULTISPECIES: cyanide-forming glycine dehydrogenase subunit HcnB [unclassified Pseudomonas]|uniref:cyanide-forming glycine dehydrogenase subunit HcnB n=1 Tax=Pseudomonas TaxID=286 RepID=UPI000D9B6EF2|nr:MULTISPECIES: cyanide-forming glycine dehydrogenase subunit HcnB [unclassified Pseudomonas]PYG76048.1 hydrogen cyanide synthase HcnB [Pseudomonas sp. RV120224-01c]PYG78608.1 hydrogen cyanide synthase HcnB [Pseudomonas sp. RV120224-01b]